MNKYQPYNFFFPKVKYTVQSQIVAHVMCASASFKMSLSDLWEKQRVFMPGFFVSILQLKL